MMTSTVAPSIGESVVRIDGRAKASGAHVFPSDFVVEGMLWLRVLRAHQPHARILSIDTSAAEQVDGVVAAGGTLASLIPPSAILVIYAIIVEQDVGSRASCMLRSSVR